MRKPPTVERDRSRRSGDDAGGPAVLSISPVEEDHRSLRRILEGSGWALSEALDLASALALLQQGEIAVVLCEQALGPATWIDLLERINAMADAPLLIVTSRCADERLWAEALNLGAWDVLAKPFRRGEVLRIVRSGLEHWRPCAEPASKPVRASTAAGGI